ncbi:MAG TPA: hypothetical protein VGJ26_16510 [Pirellulales bacterium]|jgi:uncharacterized membrane protein HdeD (DUF308 family)
MEITIAALLLFMTIGLFVVASAILRVSHALEQLNNKVDAQFGRPPGAKNSAN